MQRPKMPCRLQIATYNRMWNSPKSNHFQQRYLSKSSLLLINSLARRRQSRSCSMCRKSKLTATPRQRHTPRKYFRKKRRKWQAVNQILTGKARKIEQMAGATGFTHRKMGINNKQLGIKRYHPFLKMNLSRTRKRRAEGSVGRRLTTKRGSTERSRMKQC